MRETRAERLTDWHSGAQRYLARLGAVEYECGIRAHRKAGRKATTYRHAPSEYHSALVALLGANDEQGFKALKGEQGYASMVRV